MEIQRAPTHWLAWYELGRRRFRRAMRVRRKFREDHERSTYARYREELESAEECIRTAAHYNPTNYLVWWELAKVEIAVGRLDLAKKAFDRVVELRPYLADEVHRIMKRALWPWDTGGAR